MLLPQTYSTTEIEGTGTLPYASWYRQDIPNSVQILSVPVVRFYVTCPYSDSYLNFKTNTKTSVGKPTNNNKSLPMPRKRKLNWQINLCA